jgi:hypothetical protein
MPEFDGKGPRGLGPMTGGGRGFCILKMPRSPDEPLVGFSGRAGWPVGQVVGPKAEVAGLRSEVRRIEAALCAIRGRIGMLEAKQKQAAVGV